MNHFIHKMESQERLSQERRHLIILHGHKFHINLEVLIKAKDHGIDMISLPRHTSHELQSFDKAYFRPFKVAFRAYRDVWLIKNNGNKCKKEDLVQWASLALKKALTSKNILSGFRAIRIWPLNSQALERRIGPSGAFQKDIESKQQKEEILQEGILEADMRHTYYYGSDEEFEVDSTEDEAMERVAPTEEAAMERVAPTEEAAMEQSPTVEEEQEKHISRFLKLPKAPRRPIRVGRAEPLVDYNQSQMLALEEHLTTLETIATQKERVQEMKEQKIKERIIKKSKRAEEL